MGSVKFGEVAELFERIGATTKKTEKVRILSEFLRKLDDEDLAVLCRLLSGSIFPVGSGMEVNVGYSTLSEVIKEVSGADDEELSRVYLKYGDLGLTAEELLAKRVEVPLLEKELTLSDVYRAFESMAKAKGKDSAKERKRLVKGLILNSSPLEAKYLIKLLTGELRIGLVSGLLEEAIAEAFRCRLKDVRTAHLCLGDLGLVAKKAKDGTIREVGVRPMIPLNYMLATTVHSAKEVFDYYRKELYVEFKFDGVRCQVHKLGDRVEIFSRSLDPVTESFPEVVSLGKGLGHDFILDGEMIAVKGERPLPFKELQRRLRRKEPDPELVKEIPVKFMAYDILYLDGSVLIEKALRERRGALEGFKDTLSLSRLFTCKGADELERLFRVAKELGHEGLMIKDPDSKYTPGSRGRFWMKLKGEADTLDVVIVAAEYGHGKRAGLLSDYTFAVLDGDEYRVVGKAYSGLTDEEIREMTERLLELVVEDRGRVKLVRPEIVLEVAFDRIQRSDKYDSGFALRFPRIKAIRYDKGPRDIDTLERVRELYEKYKG